MQITATAWLPDRGQTIDDGVDMQFHSLATNKELAERFAARLWKPGDEAPFGMAVSRPASEVILWEVDVVPVPTFEVRKGIETQTANAASKRGEA